MTHMAVLPSSVELDKVHYIIASIATLFDGQ